MALNAPRAAPYEFRTFMLDGWLWIYDASARVYPCTATAHVYAEPITRGGPEDDEEEFSYPDPILLLARDVDMIRTDECLIVDADEPETDAWDAAREEAQGNCGAYIY